MLRPAPKHARPGALRPPGRVTGRRWLTLVKIFTVSRGVPAAQPDARRRPRRLPLDRHPGLRPARHRGVPDRADRLRDPGELDAPSRPRRGRGLPARPPEAVPERPARFDLSSTRPDLRVFPHRKWVDAIRAAAETAPFDQLDYAQSGGHPRLRGRPDRPGDSGQPAGAEPADPGALMESGAYDRHLRASRRRFRARRGALVAALQR
jgi:DNA-binding transcriptional MocR family regulator